MSATSLPSVPVPLDEHFTVGVSFAEPVLISLQGELDSLPSSQLALIVGAVLEAGHRSVALDLSACGFIGAAGLRVITSTAGRLEAGGGRLTVLSASSIARRLLALAGRADLCSDTAPGDQGVAVPPTAVLRLGRSTTPTLRTVTAIPASHEVVDGALRLVVTMAAAMVGGADGVSVSLRRHGTLMTVAASDSTISAMDADQYQTGEGPCVDASLQGQRFHASSLATETRWPTFTPRAQALGINAILSSPLAANNRPVGALNIYSRTSGAFGPQDEGMASLFAQETSTVLSAAGVDVTDQEMADRLAEALASRHIVALAQGVLMERSGCDEDDAYTLLRRYSAQTGQPLQARAKQIVASTRPQDGLWSGPEPRRA